MNKPAPFRQVDAKRLIRGALDAGLPVGSFKIVVDNGRLTLLPVGEADPPPAPTPADPSDDLDAELAEWSARHGYG